MRECVYCGGVLRESVAGLLYTCVDCGVSWVDSGEQCIVSAVRRVSGNGAGVLWDRVPFGCLCVIRESEV